MKIGILGAAGRMGQMIAREIFSKQHDCTLGAAVDHKKSWALGKDVGGMVGAPPCGVTVTTDKDAAFRSCDVMIDFTSPEAMAEHAELARKYKKSLVAGTTGLGPAGDAAIAAAALETPVLYSANMSLGVNLLLALVEQAAQKLGPDYDIEIFEAHHRHKIDAPSGTALMLGHAAARGRGIALEDSLVPARHGQTGARVEGSIGMSVFRGGDTVGEHTITFAGTGESLEMSHKATDRGLFAKGAIRAALWLRGKPPGLYSMRDVLGV